VHLYDEAIVAETTANGTPTRVIWRRSPLRVRRVLSVWQAPGARRLVRVSVIDPDGVHGVAEIVGEHTGGWRLRHVWR
jgi:hypothetical protein